jgi:hypothetical protein
MIINFLLKLKKTISLLFLYVLSKNNTKITYNYLIFSNLD